MPIVAISDTCPRNDFLGRWFHGEIAERRGRPARECSRMFAVTTIRAARLVSQCPKLPKLCPKHARGVRVGELAGLVASGCARIEQDKPQTTCCRTGFSCVRLRRHLRLLVLDRQ